MDEEGWFDLGPCCVCAQERPDVRNIVMLDFAAPLLGTGWGCFQCGLPMGGATAVVCDDCVERSFGEIRFVIYGQPAGKQRVAVDGLEQVPFRHDMTKHPECFPKNDPDAELFWFNETGQVGDDDFLCSYCGRLIGEDDGVPMKIWDTDREAEARFHASCFEVYFNVRRVQ